MNKVMTVVRRVAISGTIDVTSANAPNLSDQVYRLLKTALADMDIYADQQDLRLDERDLTKVLKVSRTPIREAITILQQEGFVDVLPRRGIYVVRKSKREIIELIQMWAALESMAARLATLHASDQEIRNLRHLFDEFQASPPSAHLDEYSSANIAFHTAVIALGGSRMLIDAARNLLIHVRAIRRATITQRDRAKKSIVEHLEIIEALERRDSDRSGRLCLEHTLNLAEHVERHCDI